MIYIHTYIIGHYNPSVRIIDLVSHTTYVVCVNFIHKLRDLQFKVDSERQIFWETFHGNFIYSQSFCQISTERGNRRRNTFRISFRCLAWDTNPGFSFFLFLIIKVLIRVQKWIVFSLFISTHEISIISESTILKFHYSTLIH